MIRSYRFCRCKNCKKDFKRKCPALLKAVDYKEPLEEVMAGCYVDQFKVPCIDARGLPSGTLFYSSHYCSVQCQKSHMRVPNNVIYRGDYLVELIIWAEDRGSVREEVVCPSCFSSEETLVLSSYLGSICENPESRSLMYWLTYYRK